MSQRPNAHFCKQTGFPHPAPEALWHPREFTFERLEEMLRAYSAKGFMFNSFDVVSGMTSVPKYEDLKVATIVVPVCFSPSNAVEMARVIARSTHDESPNNLTFRGTFFFEKESPSYRLEDPRTIEAIAEIHNNGHQIGVMLGITPESTAASLEEELIDSMRHILKITGHAVRGLTFRTVGVAPERVEALQKEIQPILERLSIKTTHGDLVKQPHTALVTTSNGIYKNGHPLDAMTSGKQVVVLNLIDAWFSKEPKWPLDRLGSLPEVDAHVLAVRRDYLGHVKTPILGQTGTREIVPEFSHHRGQRGFRDGLRLQASG